MTPIKLDWFDFTSCEVDKLEPTCFAMRLIEKPVRAISERTRHMRAKRSKTNAMKKFGSNAYSFPLLEQHMCLMRSCGFESLVAIHF